MSIIKKIKDQKTDLKQYSIIKAIMKEVADEFFMKAWNINATPYHKSADKEFEDCWKNYLKKLMEVK